MQPGFLRQFPVYAITLYNRQGLTLHCVAVDLRQPIFPHGQLYPTLQGSKSEQTVLSV